VCVCEVCVVGCFYPSYPTPPHHPTHTTQRSPIPGQLISPPTPRKAPAVHSTSPILCTRSPTHPTQRANSFPKVTNPFCRLPLPTFFHQLEAAHLGDLLRLWVRPAARIIPRTRIFTDRRERTRCRVRRGTLPVIRPSRRLMRFHGAKLLKKGENSP